MILLIKQSSVVAQKLRTSHKECSTSKKLLMPNHARIPILFVKIDGMPRHGLAAARRHAVRPKCQTAPIPKYFNSSGCLKKRLNIKNGLKID